MLSKHDPNFEQKRFDYIAETGLDPVTGKEADEELQNYATNYTKYASSIKAGYDFLMVGAAAWSTRAYNKDIQTQRADAQINEYYQIKDAVNRVNVNPSVNQNASFGKLNTEIQTIDLPNGTWQKGNSERGFYIDENLNGGNNVGKNYPVIDRYDPVTETATSVKSRDLNAKSYQNGTNLKSVIKKDINDLKDFELQNWGDTRLGTKNISHRVLDIVVPNTELSKSQIDAINEAIEYGQTNGVKINIIVGGE